MKRKFATLTQQKERGNPMKQKSVTIAVVVLFSLTILATGVATGATIKVFPDGTIQAGIDEAQPGDVVLVAPGTYLENINFNGKAITVQNLPNQSPEQTIIDGQKQGNVVTIGDGATLDGFTVQNGETRFFGGGIRCTGSPTITNCRIKDNTTFQGGGGIFCANKSSPNISGCTIKNNSALEWGGGICCVAGSSPTVTNCIIVENRSDNYGGGIDCYEASPTIIHCTISGNGNNANHGGGLYCFNSSVCVTNCIFWGNRAAPGDPEVESSPYSTITINYSNVWGGWPGKGNVIGDPKFSKKNPYHLTAKSFGVDKGARTSVDVDIDGQTRPWGAGFDIGADEYVPKISGSYRIR